MSKNLFSKFFVLLLVVGLLFAVAPTKQAQAAAVVTTEAELRTALTGTETEIELGASFTLAATVDVNRSVSIDGKSFTITGPAKGTEIWEGHGLVVTANNVSISNLTITGSGRSNLVFYNVTGGSATNVILSNAAHAGMIVNSSAVTISNVTTTNNTWGGINVDRGSGLTTDPLLTVLNVTDHTSPAAGINAAIWVDSGNAAWVSVDNLYIIIPGTPLVFMDVAEYNAAFPVHNVTQDTYFTTIQGAINATTTVAGDVIEVGPGTYLENITVNKQLTLTGAGRDLVTIQGSNLAENGVFNVTADDVTVEGFTIKGAGYKTVRVSASGNRLTFKNNRVIAAANTANANGWSAFETDYGQSGHVVTGNIFVGNSTAQLVYFNSGAGVTFTGNTFEGTTVNNMAYGPVLGFDALDGTQVITGNTFDVKRSGGDARYSVYALVEAFGTYDLNAIAAGNTFKYDGVAHPAVVIREKIRPAYIYNSTNELNKAKLTPGHIGQNAPYVELVSADATTNTITP